MPSLVGGLSSLYGDLTGSNSATNAAQNAADAQYRIANQAATDYQGWSDRLYTGMNKFAQMSPAEMDSLSRQYAAAGQSLALRQKQLEAIDPAIMEASKQALQILRGGTSATQAPIMNQRNLQRQQLVNSLQSQYGPGAETSSVGQRALQQFDMQTQSMMSGQLSQLMGIGGMDMNANGALAGMGAVNQQAGNIANRQIGAMDAGGNMMMGAIGKETDLRMGVAGAPWVGQSLRAQNQQQFFNAASPYFMPPTPSQGVGMFSQILGSAGGGGGGGGGGLMGLAAMA